MTREEYAKWLQENCGSLFEQWREGAITLENAALRITDLVVDGPEVDEAIYTELKAA